MLIFRPHFRKLSYFWWQPELSIGHFPLFSYLWLWNLLFFFSNRKQDIFPAKNNLFLSAFEIFFFLISIKIISGDFQIFYSKFSRFFSNQKSSKAISCRFFLNKSLTNLSEFLVFNSIEFCFFVSHRWQFHRHEQKRPGANWDLWKVKQN